MPVGTRLVEVEGFARFKQEIDLSGPAVFRVERRRTDRQVLAITSLAVGGAATALGLLALMVSPAAAGDPGVSRSYRQTGTAFALGGATVAVAGAFFGFRTAGRNQLVRDEADSALAPTGDGLRLVGLETLPMSRGGAALAATFSF